MIVQNPPLNMKEGSLIILPTRCQVTEVQLRLTHYISS